MIRSDLKDPLQRFDLALMVDLAGSAHCHSGGNVVDGAVMVNNGWGSSCIIIAALLRTKMEFYKTETSEPSDESCGDQTMGR